MIPKQWALLGALAMIFPAGACGEGIGGRLAGGQAGTSQSTFSTTGETTATTDRPAGGEQLSPMSCPNGAVPYAGIADRWAESKPTDTPPPEDVALARVDKVLEWKDYPFIDKPGPLQFVATGPGRAQVFANTAKGEKMLSFELSVYEGDWVVDEFQVCAAPFEETDR
jgi:hypothetical protein